MIRYEEDLWDDYPSLEDYLERNDLIEYILNSRRYVQFNYLELDNFLRGAKNAHVYEYKYDSFINNDLKLNYDNNSSLLLIYCHDESYIDYKKVIELFITGKKYSKRVFVIDSISDKDEYVVVAENIYL